MPLFGYLSDKVGASISISSSPTFVLTSQDADSGWFVMLHISIADQGQVTVFVRSPSPCRYGIIAFFSGLPAASSGVNCSLGGMFVVLIACR